MADEITPAGTVAPAVTATPVVAPVAPVIAATTAAVALPPPVEGDPAWLPARLERERKAFLEQLGVSNVEDVKKSLADFKAKQDADKTEAQRNAEKLSELDRVKARAAELETTISDRATRELAALTPEQKAAVEKIAGTDAAAQLRAIDALSGTWAKPATAPGVAAPVVTAGTAAATTAPPKVAPSDATTTQLSPKEQYARLKASNPIQAAHYLTQHAKEIYPSA